MNYKKADEPRKSEIEENEKTKHYILVNSLLKEEMDSNQSCDNKCMC